MTWSVSSAFFYTVCNLYCIKCQLPGDCLNLLSFGLPINRTFLTWVHCAMPDLQISRPVEYGYIVIYGWWWCCLNVSSCLLLLLAFSLGIKCIKNQAIMTFYEFGSMPLICERHQALRFHLCISYIHLCRHLDCWPMSCWFCKDGLTEEAILAKFYPDIIICSDSYRRTNKDIDNI